LVAACKLVNSNHPQTQIIALFRMPLRYADALSRTRSIDTLRRKERPNFGSSSVLLTIKLPFV
jgi:hypothetical protein